MDKLLRTVEEQLEKQREMKDYGQQKLAQFVETRFQELQAQEADAPKNESEIN
jgi:DNA-binding XRE family transcriptional regulator